MADAPQPNEPQTVQDEWSVTTKTGKDPWRAHPLKQLASLAILLGFFYLFTAGFLAGLIRKVYQEDPAWLPAVMLPAETVGGFVGVYADLLDWQQRLFQPKDAQPLPGAPPAPGGTGGRRVIQEPD